MNDAAPWECRCGREFDTEDEAREHVRYHHDPVRKYLTVRDRRNHAEPGGL